MVADQHAPLFTREEYEKFEEHAGERHAFHNGYVYAISASTTLSATAPATRCSTIWRSSCARTRADGIASRYGGEEFTLLIPEATLESTRGRAEQLRREVKQRQVQYESRVLGQITLPLGVASCPRHGSSAQSL